jgi:hypothetical protein
LSAAPTRATLRGRNSESSRLGVISSVIVFLSPGVPFG